jgi:ornithine carbamoyltransferase
MHMMNFKELNGQQLTDLVNLGIETKTDPEKFRKALQSKSLALIFQKTSTRTRVSFEVAMTQLGGHALYIDWRTTNFTMADIADEAQYLSRNVDGIMTRLLYNADVQKIMHASKVPVINGCDECIIQANASPTSSPSKRSTAPSKAKLVYIGIQTTSATASLKAAPKQASNSPRWPIFNEPSRPAVAGGS